MQSNALEKSNPNNTDTTMSLKIAVTVQKRDRAFTLESSLPTFAQSSAAAKNAIQVLEAIRKRAKNKRSNVTLPSVQLGGERAIAGRIQGVHGVHRGGKEVIDIEGLKKDEVMRREQGTALLWFS